MENLNSQPDIQIQTYASTALPHLQSVLERNSKVMQRLADQLVSNFLSDRFLFVFGMGHSGILPLELYHRAGGPSFVIPLVADHLLPHAGPPLVRFMERLPKSALFLLDRAQPKPGEMLWVMSQSGINPAGVEFALEAKARGLQTVAFTSVAHSRGVPSRHESGKRLFEVCDEVVDLGGVVGDAIVQHRSELSMGPVSSLTSIFLAHSILCAAMSNLERKGKPCVYTSVNTPEGERRNIDLEKHAAVRDPLLRQKV